MDKIIGFSQDPHKHIANIRRAQAHAELSVAKTQKDANTQDVKSKLNSDLLNNAAVGTVNYFLTDTKGPKKIGKHEISRAQSREETAVKWGGRLIKGGLALSESGIGEPLIIAGLLLDAGAIGKGIYEGHGTVVAKEAARSVINIPGIGKYIKEVV